MRSTSRSTSPRRNASGAPARSRRITPAAAGRSDAAALRQEFRAWRASLPTALERDTLLVPEWIAESVVREAERYLQTELPAGYVERLTAKAHLGYARHRLLNGAGNRGRDARYMFMRHWTCSWLKRERWSLYQRLPWSDGHGKALP